MKRKITVATQKKIRKNVLLKLARKILDAESCFKDVNIILTDDASMAELNLKFRNKKGTTDVLSFPFDEESFLGEVYISVDRAQHQAMQWGVEFEDELMRLLAHGLLHLLGYDHQQMKPLMDRYLA